MCKGYGLSVTAAVLTCNSPDANRSGSEAHAMIVDESKQIDHCGEVVPTEYEGETCVRGSQVIPGCWQKTEASAAVRDVHGWFRTRVVGVLDADGYVKIVAR